MDLAFSSVDLVGQGLIDYERTRTFAESIATAAKGSTVLDVGTGSGIMALCAAQSGAKHVTAIEFDPFIAEVVNGLFKMSQFRS